MLISKLCASIEPYVAGEQPKGVKLIKLNTNENPYPLSPKAETVGKEFDFRSLRLYPDPNSSDLKRAIAVKEGVSEDNIFVGNGSDEVLAICFQSFFDAHDKAVLFPDITYSFYPVYCALYGINYRTVALDEDFKLDVNDLKGDGGVVIANPNAPTGLSIKMDEVERLAKLNPDNVVIVDEAYIDFAVKAKSAVPLIAKHNNIVVVKTFSKSYSLAGIRCGYAVADKPLIAALNKIKDSFNSYPVDAVCQAVCRASIEDNEYFLERRHQVISTRERVKKLLLGKAQVLNSDANFLFIKHNTISGLDAYLKLRDKGILVRHFNKPRISDYLRVTIGNDLDMDEFVVAYLNM